MVVFRLLSHRLPSGPAGALIALLIALPAVPVWGSSPEPCPAPAPLERFSFSRVEMGTLFQVVLYAACEEEARGAARAALDRVRELDAVLSDYREDSEISRVAREAHLRPVVVSDDLYRVLERSLHWYGLTEKAFDVTVGPLVALWRRARQSRRLPDPGDLARARRAVGSRYLVLDPKTRSLFLKRRGMRLDVGGIGKGYAADEALRILDERGIQSALIDAGGDIRLGAQPPGQAGWKVAVLEPEARSGASEPLERVLSAAAVATSGDSDRSFEIDGIRYSHILDPRTGLALQKAYQVSVVAPDATTADALATALSVMGPESGHRLAESLRERGHILDFAFLPPGTQNARSNH